MVYRYCWFSAVRLVAWTWLKWFNLDGLIGENICLSCEILSLLNVFFNYCIYFLSLF